jgi:hypothetical protein
MASRWPASHGGGGRRVLPAAREDGDQGRCDGGMLHMGVGLAVEKRLVCTLNDWVPHVTFLGQLGGDTQKPPPTPRTLAPVAASGGGGPRWAKNDAARSPYSTSLSPSLPLLSPNHTRRCPSHLRRQRKSGPPIARVAPPDVGSVFWELGSESFESPFCLEAGARQSAGCSTSGAPCRGGAGGHLRQPVLPLDGGLMTGCSALDVDPVGRTCGRQGLQHVLAAMVLQGSGRRPFLPPTCPRVPQQSSLWSGMASSQCSLL